MVMGYPEHHPKHEAPEADPTIMPTPGLGGIDSNIQKEEVPVVKSKFGIPWKSIMVFSLYLLVSLWHAHLLKVCL
jgi:hypothetical protein